MAAGWNKGLQLKEFLCVQCGDTNEDNFYHKNKMKSCCKTCHNINLHQKTREIKIRAIEYLGNKCKKCGCDGVPAIFDFHHRNPAIKDFSWGDNRKTNWESLKPELDKCDLLCSNCHRELHDMEWFSNLAESHPERVRRAGRTVRQLTANQ